MEQQYFTKLKELLIKLKNAEGYFIIQNSPFSGKSNDNNVFCQFLKLESLGPLKFEAISHNFEKSISAGLESEFKDLGFQLEPGLNYTKDVKLDSDDAIHNIALEVVKIFTSIYNIGEHTVYYFDEQIEG